MGVEIYRAAWGLVGPNSLYPSLLDFVDGSAEENYKGVEFPLFLFEFEQIGKEAAQEQVLAALNKHELEYIPMFVPLPDNFGDYNQHMQCFKDLCKQANQLGATKINAHAGADWMGVDKGFTFLSEAIQIANDYGLNPCFETHRSRILFNPYVTAELLDKIPDLQLTADLSHWLVVLERIPTDVMDIFNYACTRTGHFHARIGFENSPQVPEPADIRWQEYVGLFKQWWRLILDTAAKEGRVMTTTPEFGPYPYMPMVPMSDKPVADVAKVNAWMRDRLDEWFN